MVGSACCQREGVTGAIVTPVPVAAGKTMARVRAILPDDWGGAQSDVIANGLRETWVDSLSVGQLLAMLFVLCYRQADLPDAAL